MTVGKVKWFNDGRGFGFIVHGDGQEIFVHWTAIQADGHKTLEQGQEVKFDIYEGTKGLVAQNVVHLD